MTGLPHQIHFTALAHAREEDTMSDQEIKITISANGSYKVEGPMKLCDHDGNPIETREGKPFTWTATADAILQKLKRFCERTSGT